VQELVNRDKWREGNALMFVITRHATDAGTGTRIAAGLDEGLLPFSLPHSRSYGEAL
jgi:hypothetical protein